MRKLFLLFFFLPVQILACSAFFSNGQVKYLGKNFDWSSGEGYILKNVPGQKKYAYGLRGNNPATWTSRYGSVTFNQIGKEFPYGGMNEKGLVVEQLWMSESMYSDHKNQTISELEWIQYQLDNYSSVEEVLLNLAELSIKPIATVHYFLADQTGQSAVIDFVEGKTVIHKRTERNQVITNETFERSEAYFKKNQATINNTSRTAFDRYCQIKNNLPEMGIDNPQQGFDMLNRSSENRENYKTYWTIIYDLSNLNIYFQTLESKTTQTIQLNKLDFQARGEIRASSLSKSEFQLEPYTFQMNERQFSTAMGMMGIKVDQALGATHQMNPGEPRFDQVYQRNYLDLTITFRTKSSIGNIYYTVISGEENFKTRKGIKSGLFPINTLQSIRTIYALPKGEYAIACFLDANSDNRLDTKLFGIPKNYGFSRNNRGFFGTPPKYRKASLSFVADTAITIRIK